MREIIFRGKLKFDEKQWIYGGIVHQTDYYGEKVDKWFIIDGTETRNYDIGYEYCVIHETIGQYTGLKDKNGKRIFEGDIIRTTEDGCPVYAVKWGGEWNYPAFDVSPQIENCECNGLSYLANDFCYEMEVIGNIHDNPELIEVTT